MDAMRVYTGSSCSTSGRVYGDWHECNASSRPGLVRNRRPHRLTGKPARPAAHGQQASSQYASLSQDDLAGGKERVEDRKPVSKLGYARDLERHYDVSQEVIGQGVAGTVHVSTERSTGYKVAVKAIQKVWCNSECLLLDPDFAHRVAHEVDIHAHMGASLNVAHFYGAFESDTHVYIVTELCTGGELWERLREATYGERQAAHLTRQVLQIIAQCHARHVILRDVKPDNLLFLTPADDAPLKAIDFGIAQYCLPGEYLTERAGTPIYVAPEVLAKRYTLSADLWSAGVISYMLLTGRLPWAGPAGLSVDALYSGSRPFSRKESFRAIMFADIDMTSHPWDQLSPLAKDFVQQLLQRHPDRRPTAVEALQHMWFHTERLMSEIPFSATIVARLQHFGTLNRLKQVVLRRIAQRISAGSDSSEVPALRAAFQELDPAGSGRLHHAQLAQALAARGFDVSERELLSLVAEVDTDYDGAVDYEEWLAAMLDWRRLQGSPAWNKWLDDMFAALDTDHSGSVDVQELAVALTKGAPASASEDFAVEVETVMREADANHDGVISRAEFDTLMLGGSGPAIDPMTLFDSRLPPQKDAEH